MSFGYDMISYDDNYGSFDENYYMEMSRQPMKTESFDNVINDLMTIDDSAKQKLIQRQYSESIRMNEYLNAKNQSMQRVIAKKNNEIQTMNNQLYLLYILLFISIILVISQKISYANLQQLYEIIRLNRANPDLMAPISSAI